MIKLVSLYVISVKVIVSKSLSLTLSKDLPYLFHRYGNWDWKKFFIPQVTQLLLANLTSEHQSVWLHSLWMCPLYTHCLNSIHQSHYPFNLYPLVLTLTVTVCPSLPSPKMRSSAAEAGLPSGRSGVTSVTEGEEGLACRDAESTPSAPFAWSSCRVITAEVRKVWSAAAFWDQQQHCLETC